MKKYGKCGILSPASSGCFSKWVVVAIMMFALSGQSCRSTKQTSKTTTGSDSISYSEKLTASLVTVPTSRANLTVSLTDLLKLPQGASFTAKSGQARATLSASAAGDTVFVSAECDSLQRLVFEYEKQLNRLQKSQVSENVKTETKAFSPDKWHLVAIGVILILILIIVIRIKK